MPRILERAASLLSAPLTAAEQLDPALRIVKQIPIRELLNALPAAHAQHTRASPASDADADAEQPHWSNAHWEGLAINLPTASQNALASTLKQLPGRPQTASTAPLSLNAKQLWHTLLDESAEQAMLLFCPAPSRHLADEAAWRLLGQICQGPFYQRLRGELQLGYAVFSGVRQLNGCTGLLFGVQSPQASHAEILGHIQDFIEQLPTLIEALAPAEWQGRCEALAAQFDPQALPAATIAELLWQARLARHPAEYLDNLRSEVLALTPQQLLQATRQLRGADGGWLCLANANAPGAPWQFVIA